MDSVSKSKTGNAINLSVDSRKNTSSTAMNANPATSTSRTFMGEPNDEIIYQRQGLGQRDVNKSIHDPNHSIGDNCGFSSKNVSAPVSSETDEVFTDKHTNSVNGSSKVVQEIDVLKKKINESNLVREINNAFFFRNMVALEDMLNFVIGCDHTIILLMKICHQTYELMPFYGGYEAHDTVSMGQEMFMFSATYNQISLAHILLKTGLITKDTEMGCYGSGYGKLMRFSVTNASVDMVKFLLDYHVDVAKADGSWPHLLSELLCTAILRKRINHARLLLNCGADSNGISINRDGNFQPDYNLMRLAIASTASIKMITLLLDEGKANPNPNDVEVTPLEMAADRNNVDCVELLLTRGAYITRTFLDSKLVKNALTARSSLGTKVREAEILFEASPNVMREPRPLIQPARLFPPTQPRHHP